MPSSRPSRESCDALLTFLQPFNAFDREEHVADKFTNLDPNDRLAFKSAVEREYFDWADTWNDETSFEPVLKVKKQLASELAAALANPETDFKYIVEESDGTFVLPPWWRIADHRSLFEVVYSAMSSRWSSDLKSAGFNL